MVSFITQGGTHGGICSDTADFTLLDLSCTRNTSVSSQSRFFQVRNGCANLKVIDGLLNVDPAIPQPTWFQTPSVVEIQAGHYRALGRAIHLKYLKEQLEGKQGLNFSNQRKTMNLVRQLDILADTVYIEGAISLHGVKTVQIFAREIVSSRGSKVDFSAPNWNQMFKESIRPGKDGESGEPGITGPQVHIHCDHIFGKLEVISSGGNGHKGQDGGDGAAARDSKDVRPDVSASVCYGRSYKCHRRKHNGPPGIRGISGQKGGNAGIPGSGGHNGRVFIHSGRLNGQVTIHSCIGRGAQPAKNGVGGKGGAGGLGGRGRQCVFVKYVFKCATARMLGRGPQGKRGPEGTSGNTPLTPGRDGSLQAPPIYRSGELQPKIKIKYPLDLLHVMHRQAEDLLLSNSHSHKGRAALKFILSLANDRSDAEDIKKDVRRKLGFLGKKGYDIFGKNVLFAPRVKWEALEGSVENVRKAAEIYEEAFNDITSTEQKNQDFKTMAAKMSSVSELQVKAEADRLNGARDSAMSEKRTYVKSIQQLEEQLASLLLELKQMLPNVYDQAKFNPDDLLAILQGITGFVGAIKGKDPLDFIDTALGLAGSQSGKQCLGSLESNLGSIKKWLTFGKVYTPLVDSSDLDFDKLDVASVPEIMQANLEMNKEKLAAELVCLLDVASRPQDIAGFKQVMESFFIAGTARIDLIGKVMDLDNEIGGYSFDIPILIETQKAITDIGKAKDTPISKTLQQTFLDHLLSTYRELERSFMKKVYELYKAFQFRTLWEGNNPLSSFQRVASESARGTGRLNGAVQLTEVLRKTKDIQDKAMLCFTNNIYTTDIMKWSFDNVKDKEIFQELYKGHTKFSLDVKNSCTSCYNIRLLKIYVELYGPEKQPAGVPDKVHLQIRHLSGSSFRAGDNSIKHYRQSVGSYRKITFDRSAVTKEGKCNRKKAKGRNTKCLSFCMNKDDSRWNEMCSHPLNPSGSTCQDKLLGMEECKSPFGIYELKIPVNKDLACENTGITDKNCKDLDLKKFTKMNVWTHFFFWSDHYPTGPEDRICMSPRNKRNETEDIAWEFV